MDNADMARNYAVKNQVRTVQPLLIKAERQFRLLDLEGTFLTLESAVAQNPNSSEALLMRARIKKMIGMQTESEQDLMRANRINPYAANLYGYHGNGGLLKILAITPEQALKKLNTFQKFNYYYQAIDNKILAEKGEDVELQKIEEAVRYIEATDLVHALDILDKVVISFPESAIAYDLKGVILMKQGKLEAASAAFFKAVEIKPDFAIAWYNIGQIERKKGNLEKAKTYLNKSIELHSNLTKAYFERALLYKQMGEKEKALNDYNTIIEMNGTSYMEAYVNRGLTKKMLGDYGGALADLNQVIEVFPNNAELRKNRGNIQLLYGLNRKAIDDYTAAIALDENDEEAYYNRALAFLLIHDKVSACSDLTKSEELGYTVAAETKMYFCSQ